MSYYFNAFPAGISFEEAIEEVSSALAEHGFAVIRDIDVRQTLKEKINADFKKYTILCACNPNIAFEALKAEDKIGLFLPCNLVVEEHEDGRVEVSATDPAASMAAVDNDALKELAADVRDTMEKVIKQMSRL